MRFRTPGLREPRLKSAKDIQQAQILIEALAVKRPTELAGASVDAASKHAVEVSPRSTVRPAPTLCLAAGTVGRTCLERGRCPVII